MRGPACLLVCVSVRAAAAAVAASSMNSVCGGQRLGCLEGRQGRIGTGYVVCMVHGMYVCEPEAPL
jgi:hypothetical protein